MTEFNGILYGIGSLDQLTLNIVIYKNIFKYEFISFPITHLRYDCYTLTSKQDRDQRYVNLEVNFNYR